MHRYSVTISRILLLFTCALSTLFAQAATDASPSLLQAQDWEHINIVGADGRPLVTLGGLKFRAGTDVRTVGGELTPFNAPSGAAGVDVSYRLDAGSETSGLTLRGRFTASPGRVDVEFDVSGVPESVKVEGSMFSRTLNKSASPLLVHKPGLWVRPANAGYPYELADGRLLSTQVGDEKVYFAFSPENRMNPEWKDSLYQHTSFVRAGRGHYKTKFSVLIAPANWPVEAAVAWWLQRPFALSLGTDQVYNWWPDNSSPLALNATLTNTSALSRGMTLKVQVRNYSGNVVLEDKHDLVVEPMQALSKRIEIPVSSTREILFAEVSATEKKTGREYFSRTNLAVFPPYQFKSSPEDSPFGLSAFWPLPSDADVRKLIERMGVRWLRQGESNQYKNVVAIQHGSLPKITGKARDEWIQKQLEECVRRGNLWWEVGNELNYKSLNIAVGLTRSGADRSSAVDGYIQWLKDIRRVQKAGGITQVRIISFGMAGMDLPFTKEFIEKGGWALIDGFALHPGRGNFTPDYPVSNPYVKWGGGKGSFWNYYGAVLSAKAVISKAGPEKPLFLTEVYAPSQPNNSWNDTLRNAAENTLLSLALAKAAGVKAAMWYQLFDGTWVDKLGVDPKNNEYFFGLVQRDLSFKPALLAYCTAAEVLDGATFKGWIRLRDVRFRGLLFESPRGPVAIVWNRADGYLLTERKKKYASPEPWIDRWKTRVATTLPALGTDAVALNAIGQASRLPVKQGLLTVTLTGAPQVIYGLDVSRLNLVTDEQ